MTDPDERVRRIRERAYRIWLDEGCPEGREEQHWHMATELVAQEDGHQNAAKPNPVAQGVEGGTRDKPVEPPEALENQGDFPGLADQGKESPAVPRRQNRMRRS